MSLADILGQIEPDGDGYQLPPPSGWLQGRALFGGLAAALCLRAARRAFPELPPLRAFQGAFVAPATGTLRLAPTLLRAGRSASTVSVDCVGEAGPAVRALLTFGGARESVLAYDRVAAPRVPAPDDSVPLPDGTPTPEFLANFEIRMAGGAPPLSGGDEHELLFWTRFREPTGDDPEAALLTVADALPPAASVGLRAMAPLSTMAWHVDVAQPVAATPWYLMRSAGEQAGEGYARQAMQCWSADGRCLATGRQTVAIFA